MKKSKTKIIIGKTDIADFPDLNLEGINIKIDSGAYTSSIHCHSIKEEDGVLKCKFLDPKHPKYHKKDLSFEEYSQKRIKSSNGITEKRYIIKTSILIFKKKYTLQLSLTERGAMRYPVLLGRRFLSRKFLIDTSKSNLSFNNTIVKIS